MFKCGKRYINILENAIPNINTLKLKCSINEFIIVVINLTCHYTQLPCTQVGVHDLHVYHK